MIRLDEDHHVHSTFSDGHASVLEMATVAKQRGLRELGFADHVRRDSDWLEDYVASVREARRQVPGIHLRIGVEAKILDVHGTLDLPPLPAGVEQVVIADHQVPGTDGPVSPRAVRAALEAGELTREHVIRSLVDSTRRAVLQCPVEPIVGHLFSVLPKIGIAHDEVDPAFIHPLLDACLERDARIEVDERWRSPGPAVVLRALGAGVRVVASTDSHNARAVGRYRYVRELAESTLCTS